MGLGKGALIQFLPSLLPSIRSGLSPVKASNFASLPSDWVCKPLLYFLQDFLLLGGQLVSLLDVQVPVEIDLLGHELRFWVSKISLPGNIPFQGLLPCNWIFRNCIFRGICPLE